MNKDLFLDGERFISASRAAEITGYSADYVGQLARGGKVTAKLVGRSWYVSHKSILAHKKSFGSKIVSKPKMEKPVTPEPSLAKQPPKTEKPSHAYTPAPANPLPELIKPEQVAYHATRLHQIVSAILSLVIIGYTGAYALNYALPKTGENFDLALADASSASVISSVLDFFSQNKNTAKNPSAPAVTTSTVNVGAGPSNPDSVTAITSGISTSLPVSLGLEKVRRDLEAELKAYVAAHAPVGAAPVSVLPAPQISYTVNQYKQEIIQAANEHTSSQSGSDVDLFAKSLFGVTNNGKLVNPTITGGNFIGIAATTTSIFSDIATSTNLFASNFNLGSGLLGNATSTNFYSPNATLDNLTVGTQAGTSATIGNLNFTNATGTNATTTNFYSANANFGSLNGGTLVLNNLVFGKATGTEATTTNFYSATGTFDRLFVNDYEQNGGTSAINSNVATGDIYSVLDSAITSGTLIHQSLTANAGNGQLSHGQLIDLVDNTTAGGGYHAFMINVSGAGTGSGEKYLVDLNPGNNNEIVFDNMGALRPTSSIASNNTSIGSPSFYWKNAYIDTITANNIAGTIVSGSTASHTWTIGSSETGDTPESLVFQRNSGSGNATLSWNASNGTKNDLRFLSTNYPLNATYTVTDSSIATTSSLYSGTLTNNTTAGTQKLLSLTNTGTGSTADGIYLNNTGTAVTAFEIAGTWQNGIVTNNNSVNLGTGGLTFGNATGTSATTTNFFTTNFSATNQILTNLLFTSATGTAATTTNSFSTTASSTNLFATNFNLGSGSLGSATIGSLAGSAVSSLTANFLPKWNSGTFANSLLYDNGTSVGVGTSTPLARLEVSGTLGSQADVFNVSSTTATNVVSSLFKVQANGNVGIGVSNPFSSAKLHVAGETFVSNTDFASGSVGTAIAITPGASSGNTYGGIQVGNTGFSAVGPLALNPSGGNVGIGTTSPATLLSVAGSAAGLAQFDSTSASGPFVRFSSSSANIGFVGSAKAITSTGALTDYGLRSENSLIFASGGGLERARLDQNGKLGIGTTTPDQMLSIFAASTPSIELSASTGGANTWTFGVDTADAGKFKIASSTAVGASARFTIDGSGNVGIGTTNPSQKLHVRGSIRAGRASDDVTYALLDPSGSDGSGELNLSGTQAVSKGSSAININHSAVLDTQLYGANLNVFPTSQKITTNSTPGTLIGWNNFGIATPRNLYVGVGSAATGPTSDTASLYVTPTLSTQVGVQVQATTSQSADLQQWLDVSSNILAEVTAAGRLGIGKTNPTTALDVVGTASSTGLQVNGAAAVSGVARLGSGATNAQVFIGPQTPAADGSGSLIFSNTNTVHNWEVDNNTLISDALTITPSTANGGGTFTTPIVTFKASGNVGIGTTTPARLLTLGGGASSTHLILQNNGTGNTIANGLDLVESTTGNAQLWNYETGYLVFGTSNNERLRIDSSGNVGIGSTTPSYKLSVDGSDRILDLRNSSAAAGNALLRFSTTGGDKFSIGYNDPSTDSFVIYDDKNSAYRFLIDNSGNVGIGTTNPGQKLDVAGIIRANSNTDLYLNPNYDTGFAALQLASNAGLQFATANATRMTISSTGNVGIGTTNPASQLEIKNSSDATLRLHAQSGNDAILYLEPESAGGADGQICFGDNSTLCKGRIIYGINSTGVTDYMNFYTSSTQRMTIDPNGNVGIGTTTPSKQLDVWGTAGAGIRIGTTGSANSASLTFNNASVDRWSIGTDFLTSSNDLEFRDVGPGGVNDALLLQHGTGNVGIGTTTPNSSFKVTASGAGFFTNNQANDSGIYMAALSGRGAIQATNNANTVVAPLSLQESGGNVGIGVTNPGALLQIGTGTGIASNAGGLTVARGDINIDSGSAGGGQDRILGFRFQTSNATIQSDAGLQFKIGVSGTPTFAVAIQNNTGYVGIGTTNPSEKLHVAGTKPIIIDQDTASTNAAYFMNYNDIGILAINRNPNTGAFADTTKSAASINLTGTTSDSFIQFFTAAANNTNPTERMRIDKSGNVGIGTTTPSTKLEVSGSQTGFLTSTVRNLAAGAANGSQFNLGNDNDSANLYIQSLSSTFTTSGMNVAGGAVVNGEGPGGLSVAATQAPIRFYTNGSGSANERMRIDTSGNVGIGVTNPAATLHVYNQSASAAPLSTQALASAVFTGTSGGGVGNGGSIGFDYGVPHTNYPVGIGYKITDNTANTKGALVFGTRDVTSDTAPTERMRIDSAGNVSIGSTGLGGWASPLGVAGAYNSNFTSNSQGALLNIFTTSAAAVDQGGSLEFGGNTGNGVPAYGFAGIIGAKQTTAGDGDYGGYLAFRTTSPAGSSATERMRIDSSGNVGIGTTTPGAKLQIYGANGDGLRYESSDITAAAGVSSGNNYGMFGEQNFINANKGYGILALDIDTTVSGGIRSLVVPAADSGTVPLITLEASNHSTNGFSGITTVSTRPILGINNYTSQLMTVLANGNVGIGITNPTNKLVVTDTTNIDQSTNAQFKALLVSNINAGASADATIAFGTNNSTTDEAYLRAYSSANATYPNGFEVNNRAAGDLVFKTSNAEHMRITSGGFVGIGMTNPTNTLDVTGKVGFHSINNQAGTAYLCWNASDGIVSQNSTACNPSSIRFKQNVQNLSDARGLDLVRQLRPVTYEYKPEMQDPGAQIGFIAEEVYPLIPEVVGLDSQGLPANIDYAKFAPVIVKAVQELDLETGAFEASTTADLLNLHTQVDALALRVTALEADFANASSSQGGLTLDATTTQGINNNLFTAASAGLQQTVGELGSLTIGVLHTGFYAVAGIFDKLIARSVHTDTLCVTDTGGETCVTRSQLDAMLANVGQTSAPAPSSSTGSATTTDSGTASSTTTTTTTDTTTASSTDSTSSSTPTTVADSGTASSTTP